MRRASSCVVLGIVLTLVGCTPAPAPVDGGPVGSPDGGADAGAPLDAATPDGSVPSVTGIDQVFTGEYVTTYLHDGQLFSIAGTLPRRGAGDHPPALFPPVPIDVPAGTRFVTGAGGLHYTIAADTNGHVWEWGDIDANPDLANHDSPIMLTNADGSPFVIPSGARSMSASVSSSLAVANDGSVWVWDDCTNGRAGDGTDGAITLHPVRVPFPAGVHVVDARIEDIVLALDDTGVMWAWGSGTNTDNLGTGDTEFRTPRAITQTSTGEAMPPITHIATSVQRSYALTAEGDLYTWGVYLEIAGVCDAWCPSTRPRLSNELIATATASGAHAISVESNDGGTYVVTSDGSLWGWGSNAQGLVGNGVEVDYAAAVPPYAYDFDKDALLVSRAVRIAPEHGDFVRVFAAGPTVFYAYAMTRDGRLFSWGRNKTGDLGNGVYPLNSQQAARYPNSWDVTVPTEVDPLRATRMPTSSPQCVAHPDAPDCWCGAGPGDPQNC